MDGTSVHPWPHMPNQCLFLGVHTKGRRCTKVGRGKARGGWGERGRNGIAGQKRGENG